MTMPDRLTKHILEAVAEVEKPTAPRNNSGGKRQYKKSDVRLDVPAYLSKYEWKITREKDHNGSVLYCLEHCVFNPAHGPNEAAIGQMPDGKLFYQCFHNDCANMKWKDARRKISGDDPIMPEKNRPRPKIKQMPGPEALDEADGERSHSQIADHYIHNFFPAKDEVVGCEGSLWVYDKNTGLFDDKSLDKVALDVGQKYNLKLCRRFADYRSVARLVYISLLDESFFDVAPIGAPCKSLFVSVKNGEVIEQDYAPQLRQRFKLGFDPVRSDCPLFSKYLNESFAGPDQLAQIALLQQIMGGIVTCSFSRIQMAVLFFGSGENGKSVLLELLDSFFPPNMKSAVDPADFGSDYHCAHLAGKAVNLVGDIERTKPLPTKFKDIVGCDTPVTARFVYKPVFDFKPRAAHIFASNDFPATADHTWGFYRRWAILEFRNIVTKKIMGLGKIISEKESPQVLAWMLAGARALAENNFRLEMSGTHARLLEEWKLSRDSVHAFLNDEEVVDRGGTDGLRSHFFPAYKRYCKESNLKALGKRNFMARCRTQLSETVKQGQRYFIGAQVRSEPW